MLYKIVFEIIFHIGIGDWLLFLIDNTKYINQQLTTPKFNIVLEQLSSQKVGIVFQPSFSRGYVNLPRGVTSMEVTESDEDDRKYLAKLREELDTSRQIGGGGVQG